MTFSELKNCIGWFEHLSNSTDREEGVKLCEQCYGVVKKALKPLSPEIESTPTLYCLVGAMANLKYCILHSEEAIDVRLGEVTVRSTNRERIEAAKSLVSLYICEADQLLAGRRIFGSVV